MEYSQATLIGQLPQKAQRSFIEDLPQVWWVRVLNVVSTLFCWSRCLRRIGLFQLTPDSLAQTAKWRAGGAPSLDENQLSPRGHEDTKEEKSMMKYKEPLNLICSELAKTDITFVGSLFLHLYYSQVLSTRMRVIQYIRQNYFDLNRQQIRRPIFVVGLPRTGTTLTYNMLAGDPNHRFPRNWQALCPTLPEKQARRAVGAGMTAAIHMSPNIRAVHEFGIDLPEECLIFMNPALINYMNLVLVFMPLFAEYMFNKADMSGVYRFHKYILQILQHRYKETRPDGGDKTWVLKTPVHLAFLDVLLQMYPDACIVWTHRSPEQAVPSTASLLRHFYIISNRRVDLAHVGKTTSESLAGWLARACAIRNDPRYSKNFYDLSYKELIKDPSTAIRGVYNHFDLPYTEAAQKAHQVCMRRMPKGKFGKHEYSPEQFGLTNQGIKETCDVYVKQYAGIL
jgi:hypothetical protein